MAQKKRCDKDPRGKEKELFEKIVRLQDCFMYDGQTYIHQAANKY